MTFASGGQYHELAFHGLALNRPIKAFNVVEIKLAQPAFLYLILRTGKGQRILMATKFFIGHLTLRFFHPLFNTGNY